MKEQPRPYHHGNLKQSLLDAAVELIGSVGLQAFTLREVARRAGVSHNAPYRHFRDKDDLLNAVAADGFNRLTESMAAATLSGHTAIEKLRLSGQGYVDFALRFPRHFMVIFDAPAQIMHTAESETAGERAFSALIGYVEDCQKEGSLPPGDATQLALLVWSLVHGIAKLAGSGRLPFSTAGEVLAFTDLATRAFQSGIAGIALLPATTLCPMLSSQRSENDKK